MAAILLFALAFAIQGPIGTALAMAGICATGFSRYLAFVQKTKSWLQYRSAKHNRTVMKATLPQHSSSMSRCWLGGLTPESSR